MSRETLDLNAELYHYLLDHSLRESPVLKNLRHETNKLHAAAMQISPEQGQFMALLMKLMGAKKTLDVGTFTGYSALVVALALPKDGKVVACDVSEEWTNIGKSFWSQAGVTSKIDLRIAPALQTLQHLIDQGEANTFDFAFIDADKANYSAYYEKCVELIRHGGLIAVDNVLWDGAVADPQNEDKDTRAIRALNDLILKDDRVEMSMLPIGRV